jgi:excisionase family DNA binding protein
MSGGASCHIKFKGKSMNKAAAAAYIGVSVRTLQRLTSKGEIPFYQEQGKKGKETHYDEADLIDYLQKNKPTTIMRPGSSLAMTSDMTDDATPNAADEMLAAFRALAAPVKLSEKFLLSLPEAAALSGVPVDKLRSAVNSGALKAIRTIGRGLGKVRRSDLENYVSKLK